MITLEKLKAELALGRISRRQFMEGALFLGLTATAASFAGVEAMAATPKKGGTLRAGLAGGATTDSMDAATHNDTFMQMLGMGCVFDCLTEVKADGSLAGELAESWDASNDAVTWTFKLREGAEFHNGKTVTADDVIASMQHHLGEDTKSAAKPIIQAVEEMKKDGDNTVVFRLKNGNADFPYLLSDYHLLIYPSEGMKEAMQNGIGTGGYAIESFEPGVRAVAKRNPNYYKEGTCHFDSIELVGIADVSARMNALMTGEVDVINRIDLKTEHLLKRNKNVEIFEVTGNQHFTFPMITTQSPYDDNHIRLALKYAIDREEVVETILRGHGIPGNDHPIGPANQYWHKDLEQRTYDPDKAKFHMKKAGVDSLAIDMSAADAAFAGAVDTAVLYKEHAAAAGIDINVIREPNDGYWSNIWMKKSWCACYWSGRATEDWMFSTAYEKGVPWNDSFWEHEKFNQLLLAGRAELDTSKRQEIYHEMQGIVKDEGGVVIPMFANYVDANSNKLAHPETLGNTWQMDGCRIAERWWFA